MSSAEVGPVGYFRLGLHGEFLHSEQLSGEARFSARGDRDTRVQGALSFGITPLHYFELFGAISASENRNRRICGTDASGKQGVRRRPTARNLVVIRSLGALTLGPNLPIQWNQGSPLVPNLEFA